MMTRKRRIVRLLTFILICLFVVGCVSQPHSDYLTVRAKIDGHSSRLALDTGATNLTLFRSTAKRLNLEASNPAHYLVPRPGRISVGYSEKCRLSCPYMNFDEDVIFGVFGLQSAMGAMPCDGVIGWENLKCNILFIDADEHIFTALEQVPETMEPWSQWRIFEHPNALTLLIRIPDSTGQDGVVFIDTGDPGGVSLNTQRWNDLKDGQKGQPYSLFSGYTPAVGWRVYEERRAETLDIGGLTLSDVPVRVADAVWEQAFPNYQATLGLFALSRLEVIIDGPGGVVYTRPKQNPRSVHFYGRLGAAFVPKDSMSDHLVAHVAENSPAYQAGLRNGDILLEVEGRDATRWKRSPSVFSPLVKRKTGSKVKLLVMRDNESVLVTVELVDIFPQKDPDDKKQRDGSSVKDKFNSTPVVFCEDSNILKKLAHDRQVAEHGDVQAQYDLGEAYCIGMGMPQDYSEAAKWWSLAAAQGHADALFCLGYLYDNGYGVKEDDPKAVELFTQATQQGHAKAQYNLGNMYLDGDGIERDYAKAFELFTQAAQQEVPEAKVKLGRMYLNGHGIEKDYSKAIDLFTQAAQQGVPEAWTSLGFMCLKGYGVERDYTKAFELFTQAANQGDAQAQNNLGFMYFNGRGVPKDDVQAYKWALVAEKNGNYNHQMKEYLEFKMTSKQKAEARRLANEYLEQKKLEKESSTR